MFYSMNRQALGHTFMDCSQRQKRKASITQYYTLRAESRFRFGIVYPMVVV